MVVHEFKFWRVVVGGAELIAMEYQPDMVAILPSEPISSIVLLEQSWINVGPDDAPVFRTVRDIVLEQIQEIKKEGTMQ